ncbi:MAG: hypothetical protein EXQ93_05375 [Alphaproteobacteria bacterium]|nr:hypothetical protein [Alphaproteobacteria bacterium]
MMIKTFALPLALVAGLTASLAHADVVPAEYTSGIVTNVDATDHTLGGGGQTYAVDGATLRDVSTGSEVDIAYVTENGMRVAIGVDIIDGGNVDLES